MSIIYLIKNQYNFIINPIYIYIYIYIYITKKYFVKYKILFA